MKEIVEKKEVEELLGCEITDEQFEEALKYARHKQEYIYQREHRQVVLQHWYLVKLTEEYVRSLAFSKFTMDLCRTLQDMEKEHPIINQSAPTNNHKEAEIKAVKTMKKDDLLTKAVGMGLEVTDDDTVDTLKEKIVAELSK